MAETFYFCVFTFEMPDTPREVLETGVFIATLSGGRSSLKKEENRAGRKAGKFFILLEEEKEGV